MIVWERRENGLGTWYDYSSVIVLVLFSLLILNKNGPILLNLIPNKEKNFKGRRREKSTFSVFYLGLLYVYLNIIWILPKEHQGWTLEILIISSESRKIPLKELNNVGVHNWGNMFLLSLSLILIRDSFKYESCRSHPIKWTPIIIVFIFLLFLSTLNQDWSVWPKRQGRSMISTDRP